MVNPVNSEFAFGNKIHSLAQKAPGKGHRVQSASNHADWFTVCELC